MSKSIILFLVSLLFTFTLYGQKCKCDIPEKLKKGLFDVEKPKEFQAKVGEYFSITMKMKSPKKAKEVNDVDFITCPKHLLDAAHIDYIKINEIKNLPKGVSWICSHDDCNYLTEETGCVTIYGTPTETGVFNTTPHATGGGSFLGFHEDLPCVVEAIIITVTN